MCFSGIADTEFKIQPSAKAIRFPSDVAYLLVGCLGGLGRSLTTFMMERGARDFVFLSRSGADKPEAAAVSATVKHLESID
jgi:KR domain